MLAPHIESLLRSSTPALLTEGFLWVLLGVFLMALYWTKRGRHHLFTRYAPTLLTSLGIVGTFAGIVIGLLDFDPTDIDGSIAALLAGLKTAFISSLAGMLLSIVFKGLASTGWLNPPHDDVVDDDEVTAAHLHNAMLDQARRISELREAIAGDTEGSLAGQLRLLRSEIGDASARQLTTQTKAAETLESINAITATQPERFEAFSATLWDRLHEFAEMMSKSATEQVIEALKGVIQDFNRNLTEQFGENFKQLNEAVKLLVDWQENYKVQLSQMHDQYEQGVQGISATRDAVQEISTRTSEIPTQMAALGTVVTVNQQQIDELDRHLDAFAEIRDKAVAAVPEIRDQIDLTIKGSRELTQSMTASMQEAAAEMNKTLAEGSTEFKNNVSQTNAALAASMQEATTGMSKTLAEGATEFTNNVSQTNSALTASMQEAAAEMNKTLAEGSTEFKNNVSQTNAALIESAQTTANSSEQIKTQFSDSVKDINDNFRNLITSLKNDSTELSTTYKSAGEQLVSSAKDADAAFTASLRDMQVRFEQTVQGLAETHRRSADDTIKGLEQGIRDALSDTGEAVKKEIKWVDDTRRKEIENSMQELGNALASITRQFTADYTQMVEEMQRIIRAR